MKKIILLGVFVLLGVELSAQELVKQFGVEASLISAGVTYELPISKKNPIGSRWRYGTGCENYRK